ncbi:hypothetical protein ACTPOK_30380 [Streptomyces inhibens]|uniref:hypothetical protein n=1 Tax=Streptomyces inhibens TaxID=2293571 RepID=UPI00402AF29C
MAEPPESPGQGQEEIRTAEPAEAGATVGPEARVAELTQRIAELEQEKSARERQDTITDLAQRFQYVTADMLHAFGSIPTEDLEERAQALNTAIHEREKPRSMGSGGLDPHNSSGRQPATWAGAFQRAREQRRNGRSGVTLFSNSRGSGEL